MLNRVVRSFKFNKFLCEVYVNVVETETFNSTVTRKSFKINNSFDYDDKLLIYHLTSNQSRNNVQGKLSDGTTTSAVAGNTHKVR